MYYMLSQPGQTAKRLLRRSYPLVSVEPEHRSSDCRTVHFFRLLGLPQHQPFYLPIRRRKFCVFCVAYIVWVGV